MPLPFNFILQFDQMNYFPVENIKQTCNLQIKDLSCK